MAQDPQTEDTFELDDTELDRMIAEGESLSEPTSEADEPDEAATPTPDGEQPEAAGSDAPPDAATAAAPTDDAASTEAQPDADPPAQVDEPPKPEPLRFTVDGKSVDVPGATVAGDTITIPREAFQRTIQPYLADRGAFARREAGYKQEIEAGKARTSAEAEQGKAIVAKFAALLDMTDEQRLTALDQLRDQLPVMVKDAELKAREAELARYKSRETDEDRTAQAEALASQIPANLDTWVDHYLAQPEFAALKGDRDRIRELLWEDRTSIYTAKDGAVAVNEGRITAHLTREAKYAATRQAQTDEASKRLKDLEAAARQNAKDAAKAAKQAPPAVPSKGTPSGAKRTSATPTTREEWDADLAEFVRSPLD